MVETIVLDGTRVADRIREDLAGQVVQFKEKYGYAPALGAVLAGDDPASAQYVRMKQRACERIGITSKTITLTRESTQEDVDAAISSFNDDPAIHGILVQLPLPPQVNEERALRLVSLDKDVDGFHPLNIGTLAMKGREPSFVPATPAGVMVLLEESGVDIAGANAVVLGRSNIVGLPVAMLLQKANATVTIVHSRSKDIPGLIRQADILVAAIGRPNYVQGDWLKPGVVVIDVGTNKIDDPNHSKGYRFVGDVDFDAAQGIAGAISKVPGGVGPMTITMLLQNTVKAAWKLAEGR